jgi:hypothetical protein
MNIGASSPIQMVYTKEYVKFIILSGQFGDTTTADLVFGW